MLSKMYSGLIFAVLLLLSFSSAYGSGLCDGYYNKKCSEVDVEKTIYGVVKTAEQNYPGVCAGVIRLHFHDCFVRGCDGSVLLTTDIANNTAERFAIPNLSLRDLSFKAINDAKAAVEEKCPRVVSCADILAYAARDCVNILGGFYYDVSGGRLDGKISIDHEALANLPAPFFNVDDLKKSFASKGLNTTDLVVLSGGHSIGVSHCSSFGDRLHNDTKAQIGEIDAGYQNDLEALCAGGTSVIANQDGVTQNTLDSQWYANNLNKKVLFNSDWELLTDPQTLTLVQLFGNNVLGNVVWQEMFKCSMRKMGEITDPRSLGDGGEIRKVCSAVNPPCPPSPPPPPPTSY